MKTNALQRQMVTYALAFGLAMSTTHSWGNDKIIIMTSGIEKLMYLPAQLAQNLGYFKEEGLQIELQTAPSGMHSEDALLAGAAQGVVGAYDHTISLQAKGKSVQSVIQFTRVPGEALLARTKSDASGNTRSDFKNRKLGVTGLGSSTSYLTQYLAQMQGVKRNEYILVPVGSGTNFVSALTEGRIDAGMTTEPTASRMVSMGQARVIVDLRTPEVTQKALGGLYPFACLYMQTSWINKNREATQKIVRALTKSLKYFDTHTGREIAEHLPNSNFGGNRAQYIQALDTYKSMFIADGLMPASGPATVLNVLSVVDKTVRSKSIDLDRTYTTEFVKQALALERSPEPEDLSQPAMK